MSKKSLLPREVFLSHASKDRRMATRIADFFRKKGIAVWYSKTHIKGGQQWHDEIGKALARCDWFLVLLTPAAVRSDWVQRELLFALNDSRYKEQIVPLNYQSCDFVKLSWTLGGFQFVDFTGTMEAGAKTLLDRWGIKAKTVEKPLRNMSRG